MPRSPKENIVSSPTVELLAQPTKELKKTQEDIETEEDIPTQGHPKAVLSL